MHLPSFKNYVGLFEVDNRYKNVDWTQRSPEIAKQLNVSKQSVVKARKQYAPHTINPFQHNVNQKTRDSNFDPSTIDWAHKSTMEIARELGVTPTYVSLMRREYAPETLQIDKFKPKGINWAAIDWRKSTTDLANELGVRTSTVSEQRAKHARKTLLVKAQLYDWNNIDWQKSNEKIADELFDNVIKQYSKSSEDVRRYFNPIFKRWFITHYIAVRRKIYSK